MEQRMASHERRTMGYQSFPREESRTSTGGVVFGKGWWVAGLACCTLGAAALALAASTSGGSRGSLELMQRMPSRLMGGLDGWEKDVNQWSEGAMLYGILDEKDDSTNMKAPHKWASKAGWERDVNRWSEGAMLYGILDEDDGTDMEAPHKRATSPSRSGPAVVSAALQRGDGAQSGQILAQSAKKPVSARGKQMMLWNAAAGDEVTASNLGHPHPSDAQFLWAPKIGGLGHALTEDEFLATRKRGARVTSKTDMDFHPMKWLHDGSRLARMTSLADAYASQLREADSELHEAHSVEHQQEDDWREMHGKQGSYWWNVRTGVTQWHSPSFNKVRAEQSKLLGVHNEGIIGELQHLRAMAALN